MKKFLVLLFAAVLAASGFQPLPAAAAPPPQWRSLWVDAFNPGLNSPSEISRVVAEAKAANLNSLFVQTVRRFDCFCNRSSYPRSASIGTPAPFDPLAEMIRQGHAAGLRVHAWVNVGTLWNSTTAPPSSSHVYNTHGPTATGANRWLDRRYDGTERVNSNVYVDLGNPAAVDYIVAGVNSIVRNYDVDGVNLDYIRYPDRSGTVAGNDWGYSDTSMQRYRAATGTTGRPTPSDSRFSQWRRDQVTGVVRRISQGINGTDPSVVLSVNGISYGYGPSASLSWEATAPYAEVLQDWYGWTRAGLIDAVALMNYKRQHDSAQAAMFASWNQFLVRVRNATDRQMISGAALYLNTRPNSIRQAQAITSLGLGWSGFSYANASQAAAASTSLAVKTDERRLLLAALKASVFPTPVSVPEMLWKKPIDVYSTPGYHNVSGREWRTSCEPYSQTVRCRTDIWATTVVYTGGRYVKSEGWVFNNLTYLALMTRAAWGSNPLAHSGSFTSDGRQWRTECDTVVTGRNGCRSYILALGIVQAVQNSDGSWRYYRTNVWLFNNMVRFKI
ncbi:family 10 glycosylhydrolase [Tessaracoccus sp. OS52]|uniref:glycoside hydrolase family 10 protein n=1 Tax=Tessaracoccus sp. OS52 TaxID=2886691 RepID=UPI001D12122F|nr:family 10 glycosylhydrolase [Tessaracoccus sp. OS52]MCC2593761.1 family 10 glycosylhydrolase [Tessaracoccus sp. OS52]